MSSKKSHNANLRLVGVRIRLVREKLGKNYTQFAEKIGISPAHVARVEKGKQAPSSAFVKGICNAYFVNEEYLQKGADPIFISPSKRLEDIVGGQYEILESMGFVFREPSVKYSHNHEIMKKLDRLSPKDRELIEGLIDRCLELHGQIEEPTVKRKKASGE